MDRPAMLWHCAYHDGPLNGVAALSGQAVWFSCTDIGGWAEDPAGGEDICLPRIFRLHRLTEEQLARECLAHAQFQKYVGYHTDHGYRDQPFDEAGREMNKFYEWQKTLPSRADYTANEILGTFSEDQFRLATQEDRPAIKDKLH